MCKDGSDDYRARPMSWNCCKGDCTSQFRPGMFGDPNSNSFSCHKPLAACDCKGASCVDCTFSADDAQREAAEKLQRQKDAEKTLSAEVERILGIAKQSMICPGATAITWNQYQQPQAQLSAKGALTGKLTFKVTAASVKPMDHLHLPLERTKIPQGDPGGCTNTWKPGDIVSIARREGLWNVDSNVFYEIEKVMKWGNRGCSGGADKVFFAHEKARPSEGGDGIFLDGGTAATFLGLLKAEGDFARVKEFLLRAEQIRYLNSSPSLLDQLKAEVPQPTCTCKGANCAQLGEIELQFNSKSRTKNGVEQVVDDFADGKATFQFGSTWQGSVDVSAFE